MMHVKAFFVRYPTGRHDCFSTADVIEFDGVMGCLGCRVIKGRILSFERAFGNSGLMGLMFNSRGRSFASTGKYERVVVIPTRERGYLLHVFCLEYPYSWSFRKIDSMLRDGFVVGG